MTAAHAIQDGDLISRSASVVCADTVDEAILIDIDSGYFFQLNKSAARIWETVETPRPFSELCAALQATFKASPETCRADAAEFIRDMQERGLLKIDSV
ncbi:MAG TPA: PqqD family protein [Caulobacteraceae bacterium]